MRRPEIFVFVGAFYPERIAKKNLLRGQVNRASVFYPTLQDLLEISPTLWHSDLRNCSGNDGKCSRVSCTKAHAKPLYVLLCHERDLQRSHVAVHKV